MKAQLEQYVKSTYDVVLLIEPVYDLSTWTLVAKLTLCDLKKQYEAYIKGNLGYILEFSL